MIVISPLTSSADSDRVEVIKTLIIKRVGFDVMVLRTLDWRQPPILESKDLLQYRDPEQ